MARALRLSGPYLELFLIPVVNIEFYPSWFLPVFPCLYFSVLCKNPVTSLYLARVSPNFPIFFCIKSLMLDLTNYIQIQHT
ncbi:mCG147133, partial [Mus musculus]